MTRAPLLESSYHSTSSDRNAQLHNSMTPFSTFTALLHAAQSVDYETSSASLNHQEPTSLIIQRRLRNRASCRKTRLKRKLQQHALDLLARERQERHTYLTRLTQELRSSQLNRHDVLYREFAMKSLHYALVDPEYTGWFDTSRAADKQHNSTSSYPSKILKRAHDKDISTSSRRNATTPQASLFKQWRVITNGLQNVDFKLTSMDETHLGAGVYEQHCYWRFIAVSSSKVQHHGEISAVAVSGITKLWFCGRHIDKVDLTAVQQEDNVAFTFELSTSAA